MLGSKLIWAFCLLFMYLRFRVSGLGFRATKVHIVRATPERLPHENMKLVLDCPSVLGFRDEVVGSLYGSLRKQY